MAVATGTAVAIGATVASTSVGAYSAYEQGQAQEKAQEEREKQVQRAKVRETRKQLRENRQRQAMVSNTAAQTGVQGSSLELGTQSNLNQQLGTNLETLNTELQSQQNIFNVQEDANRAATYGAIGKSIFGAVGSVAGNMQGTSQTGRVNMQGQDTALTNNTAFVKRL